MVCRYLRMNPEKVKLKDLEAYEILIEDDGKRRVYLIEDDGKRRVYLRNQAGILGYL